MSSPLELQIQPPLLSAEAFLADDDSDYLPWQIAFRVKFPSEKLGLRFHPAQTSDTGNGIYTIRLLELTKGPDGSGPAQRYNKHLQLGQEHLTLRPGLYLTHINDFHLVDVPCEEIILSLQATPRPITLRFVDVEAGIVTRHELRDSLQLDGDELSAAIAKLPGSQQSSPRRQLSATKLAINSTYKIILLGSAGVGKSSLLSVSTNGDDAYTNRRSPTLEAEFGSIEFPDPNDESGTKYIVAHIWDTAGQERFRAITRSHYRRADGALLVYDVSDAQSFDRLNEWLNTLRNTAGDSLTAAMVLENKVDKIPKGTRPVKFAQPDKVNAFCEVQNLLFARTTAKQNARAHEWDGGLCIFEAVQRLVLHIHKIRTGPLLPNEQEDTTMTDDKTEPVILIDSVVSTPKAMGECGGCNTH
ncbi:putative small GTP-binding protein [Plasmopara halstedii]